MKIAFCGDSFCACTGPINDPGDDEEMLVYEQYRVSTGLPPSSTPLASPDYDWPWLVAQHFNADIICSGVGGLNFFHSFKKLLKRIDEVDYIILCVTDPYRLINKHQLPMNSFWRKHVAPLTETGKWLLHHAVVSEKYGYTIDTTGMWTRNDGFTKQEEGHKKYQPSKEQILELEVSSKHYHEHIMDREAAEVMQHAFVMFVDNLMVKKNKKCIWLNSFGPQAHHYTWNEESGWPDVHIPQSGPQGNIPLYSICEKWVSLDQSEGLPIEEHREQTLTAERESDSFNNSLYEFSKGLYLDKRRNHFTKRQNIRMSEMIIDTIKFDSFDSGTLHMEDWFTLSDETQGNDSDPFIYP